MGKTGTPKREVKRSVRGWGVTATLVCDSAKLLELAIGALPKGFALSGASVPGPRFGLRAARGGIEFTQNEQVRFLGRSKRGLRAAVADAFETYASTHSRTFAFLHAGCVEVDGRVILLPGRSYAGKSTLVAAFLRRGAAYLSDDMVPIDRRLRAHPFPRPIGLRSEIGGAPRRTPIQKLGARPAEKPLPLALVWCGRYDPLATRPSFSRRPGLKAFAALLPHCPGAQIRPGVIVPILTGLARTVPVFAGGRGDADQMVDAVLKRLRKSA